MAVAFFSLVVWRLASRCDTSRKLGSSTNPKRESERRGSVPTVVNQRPSFNSQMAKFMMKSTTVDQILLNFGLQSADVLEVFAWKHTVAGADD